MLVYTPHQLPKSYRIMQGYWWRAIVRKLHGGCSCNHLYHSSGRQSAHFCLRALKSLQCVIFCNRKYSLSKEQILVVIDYVVIKHASSTVDVAVDPCFLDICSKIYSPSRWVDTMVAMDATDVLGGITRVVRQFWRASSVNDSSLTRLMMVHVTH